MSMGSSVDKEAFFSRIAGSYNNHYERGRKNLHTRRLDLALEGDVLTGKSVLDIGAGTGPLYQLIHDKGISAYHAIDLSGDMMSQSDIPVEMRTCGSFESVRLERKFDRIYALGLHTYLDPDQEVELWHFIADHLSEKGIAVVSFTNAQCPLNHLRSGLKKLLSGLSIIPWHPSVKMASMAHLYVSGLDILKMTGFNPIVGFLPSRTQNRKNARWYTDFIAFFSLQPSKGPDR